MCDKNFTTLVSSLGVAVLLEPSEVVSCPEDKRLPCDSIAMAMNVIVHKVTMHKLISKA
jgi:hypothetical protein